MTDSANAQHAASGGGASPKKYYQREFWAKENLNYARPHHRLEKSARIINKLARGEKRDLLDVGCGPATLRRLLDSNIHYHGLDIAIQDPAPNLLQANLLETPIGFDNKQFDIIVAQGFFEYIGEHQDQKLAEISNILSNDGMLMLSYTNFAHRGRNIHWPFNNIQTMGEFRRSVAQHFRIRRFIPTAHNWNHTEPTRKLIKAANMHFDVSIPLVSPALAVE